MKESEQFNRAYLFVDERGDSSTEAVASLLEAAARALRGHGALTVHHVAFDVDDDAADPRVTLTIYYDRIERRQHPRQ